MMQNEQKNEKSEFKFCKTFNCIYMLTCGVCGFRYIGQTSGAMNLRINQHRSDIGKNTTTKNIGRIEIQHFNKHGFEDVALNIIKIVPNKINRLWYENVYIGIYNAMYPYGLNVIWNNKNLIQAVKQNDKESIYNIRNNSNKRKRVEVYSMHNATTGADIFDALKEFVKNYKLPLDKLVCLATDGVPTMTGITKGAVARFKEACK
ncbi:general transcription factor II-I repeat domain-containing protein 2 [Trichonephila clavipes]|nr:general transcription factor II-I repeat domain-containing protein 2 [Trichonephila clavipes]